MIRTAFKILLAILAILIILVGGFVIDGNLQIAREEVAPAEQGAPGQFVTHEGRKLHVLTLGDPLADPTGAPIMLVHGFSAAGYATWLPWAEKLHAAGRSVIVPDLLGFGHSERVIEPGDHYGVPARARQVLAIADAFSVTTFDVVGESYGGAVTAQLALSAPEHLRKAIFMDAQIYPQVIPLQKLRRIPFMGAVLTWNSIAGGPNGFAAVRCRTTGDCRWLDLSKRKNTVKTFHAIAASNRNDEGVYTRIDDIKTPSIVIWGSEDKTVPVANGDRLARELGSPFVLINGAGHVPYFEQPDKVAERVLAFLGREK